MLAHLLAAADAGPAGCGCAWLVADCRGRGTPESARHERRQDEDRHAAGQDETVAEPATRRGPRAIRAAMAAQPRLESRPDLRAVHPRSVRAPAAAHWPPASARSPRGSRGRPCTCRRVPRWPPLLRRRHRQTGTRSVVPRSGVSRLCLDPRPARGPAPLLPLLGCLDERRQRPPHLLHRPEDAVLGRAHLQPQHRPDFVDATAPRGAGARRPTARPASDRSSPPGPACPPRR